MPNEFPSDNEFDFSSVDELTNSLPTLDQDPKDFDLSSVDKLLPKNKKTKLPTPKNPQPLASATSGGKVRSGYGARIPPKKGASSFHRGIDISASAGTPVNPADEGEVVFVGNRNGKGLSVTVRHLDGRETEYNHLAKTFVEVGDKIKREAVIGNVGQTGIATGPHLDFRVLDENGNYVNPFNELSTDPRVDGLDLELNSRFNTEDFDFSAVDNVAKEAGVSDDETVQATDPDKIEFKIGTKKVPALLHWMTSNNKPKIVGTNPYDVGDVIKTKLDWWGDPEVSQVVSGKKKTTRPDVNTVTDTWLRAWNPEYEQLNKKFREETNGLNIALVDSEANLNYLGKGQYEVQARPSRGVKALFEAYKKDGLAGFNATNQLINKQISVVADNYQEAKRDFDIQVERRPYLNAAKAGIEHEAAAITHLVTNVKYLGDALITGNIKGYNSQEYLDLINRETAEQQTIADLESSIYNPPSFSGKVISGAVSGAVALPRFVVAGRTIGLPTMVYLENLHLGNRQAAIAALPMAVMSGSMHGAGEFLRTGGGTSAPFRNITQKNLSLFQDSIAQGENVTINNLTPLKYQLIMRGSNALLSAGSSIITNPQQSLEEFAANLVVGLTFPVGKAPREKSPTILPVPSQSKTRIPLLLEPARIDFPVSEPRTGFGIIENARDNPTNFLPSGEVGQNKYGERFAADVETGFKAQATPQNIRLDLDTAALNLLDLRRALKEQTYKNEGDDLATLVTKQQSIHDAINYLEKAIPKEALEFFEKNETLIREAIKGNAANRAKGNIAIDEVEPVRIKEPVYKDGKLRADVGNKNTLGTNRDRAEEILNNFFNVTNKKSTLQSTIIPYGDVIARKIQDLGYLSAFFMEDYYHRGIEPRIDVIANRLRDAIGEFGKHLSDENIKAAYKQGVDYLNTNLADPFFSKLKQDASEKLPNRMNVEQAINVLSQHKDEFEWTVGLSEFLEANKDRKINKQELVDVIQKGQVRVKESVASKERSEEITREVAAINNKLATIDRTPENDSLVYSLQNKVQDLISERASIGLKYSLEVFTLEKLELPGARNSKEVKLISPILEIKPKQAGRFNFDEDRGILYKSPHWDEPNVVAHYRANDRITTDNQRVYFGEEFQSDWNHDIREYGAKLTFKEAIEYAKNNVEEFIDERGNVRYRVKPRGNEKIVANDTKTRQEAIDNFVTVKGGGGIEPNPFMQHNWKELVLKRFLRDAAIARDENGNYKYDGVGWTTARQQLERYGGILEGKEFTWQKNSDGTYTFGLYNNENPDGLFPHELERISLDRFAELTTKEAAQEVRDQEAEQVKFYAQDKLSKNPPFLRGEFKLKEVVELRSGKENKYADYDEAYKNIVKKIGKRFGAKYSEKEMETFETVQSNFRLVGSELDFGTYKSNVKNEKIHYLEITPSMRQSLAMEGLPLFGLGASEQLKNPETGIRNRIVTREAFDIHRNELLKSLEETIEPIEPKLRAIEAIEKRINETDNVEDLENMRLEIEKRRKDLGNVFNSGLNPDALIDQFKLLYTGVKDFQAFSSYALKRFGEQIRPFLQDLWIQVQGIQDVVSSSFNDLADYLQKGKDSPVFKSRQFKEGGFLGLGTKASKALEDYKKNKQREGIFRVIPPKLWRGIGLAQADTDFGQVYDTMRNGQRARNSFEHGVLDSLKEANDFAKKSDPNDVAEIIFKGNEQNKVFTTAELTNAPINFSPEQIDAYHSIRRAEDLNLEWRKQHHLYNMRERVDKLNDKLLTLTPGTPAHDNVLNQILDMAAAMSNVNAHYEHLKNTGYISLQRQGKIVALATDATGLLYQHFDSAKAANKWVLEKEASGATGAKIYDFRKPQDLREASAKLTPGQFEDLIDQSGVNPNAADIELLRDEIYSRYPSYSYQLKRDFTRGYDRNWKFVLDSIAHQTEVYANSFYSRVAGNEALKKLSALDLYNKKPEMYDVAKKFIDDEISSPSDTTGALIGGGIRKGVYLINLGLDLNQLYLNAVAQPITQTYSYFARVEHNGIRLGRGAAEKYFIKAGALINAMAAKKLGASIAVDPAFELIYSRLQAERVIEPEFNKSLLEIESQKSVQNQLTKKIGGVLNFQQLEHWASVFMRAGEKTTRAHAAAEAYLVGTEKFSLTGNQLMDFIVRAVDATQSNPSRAEAPYYVRKFGEAGKLFYQFNAFNHMWAENLALNVRADFNNRGIRATAKHLAPLVIMGGIRGLPLSAFALGMYTLITGDDIKKEYFDKWFKNHENLERLALYGITTSPSIAQKVTPSVPILDTFRVEDTIKDTIFNNLESSTIPALSTSGQILQGFDDLLTKDQAIRGLSEISPRVGRGPLVVARTSGAILDEELVEGEGYRTRGGKVILHKKKITSLDRAQQFFNITPIPVTEYYERRKAEKLKEINKKIKKRLNRLF